MAFIFYWFISAHLSLASVHSIEIEVGQQKMIALKKMGDITVTNPKVIKVLVKGHSINIIAKAQGKAEVKLSNAHFKIVVFSQKLSEARKEVQKWVSHSLGLSLTTNPDKIVVSGVIHSIHDWITLQRFKRTYGKIIESRVSPSPVLLSQLNSSIGQALKERALFGAKTTLKQNQIELLVFTKEKSQLLALKDFAEEWGVGFPAGSREAVELKPMIEIEVVIAEMKKNSLSSLGFQLPGTYSATVIPAGDLSSASTTFEGITPTLHALFTDGTNKVLATPKLLCRSGDTAHFVAGGEIPIKILSWKTSDVIWKRYGVILDITPLADLNEGISTKLVTEVSLIDEAHTVDHIPGFLTNRIETHFDIRGSKTIALSGLIKSEMGRGTTGTPILSDIPILGELFKSKDYRDNKTELVVFVTPRVINPENPPVAKIPNFWKDENEF